MNEYVLLHLIIFAVHWVPLVIAAVIWPHKAMRWRVPGVFNMLVTCVAGLVVLLVALMLMDAENRSGHGTSATFYLIFGVVTLGVIPALLIGIHVYFGRYVGWAIRKYGVRSQLSRTV